MSLPTSSFRHIPCTANIIAERLEHTRWVNDFSWPQIVLLGQYFKLYAADAGCLLFEEGGGGQSMGIVLNGTIDISKQGKLIEQLKTGRTYGEMSLIDSQPRSASAIARDDSEVLVMERAMLLQLAEQNPTLAFKLLWKIAAFLSQNLRKTSGHLVDFL